MPYQYSIGNEPADTDTPIQLDELLNRMAQSKINFRRSILIFCAVCIVTIYEMYERICLVSTRRSLNLYASRMKSMYIHKMRCLDLYVDTTTETKITFADIAIFNETVLNPLIGREFGRTLVETARKIMGEAHRTYNPRSLKDLTRCKIRACVPSSVMLTERVKHFTIPETLKKFILFHREEFWELLVDHQVQLHSNQLLRSNMLSIENVRDN